MGICRRAKIYLTRKRGKTMLLFLIFFLVSLFLTLCFSILTGTGQAAKDLRSNIGAAFYIRPYAEMKFNNGEMEEPETPVISEQDIKNVLSAAGGEVKTYNTEHYGYAKSEQLHFIPGVGENADSNMGHVTAVRNSKIMDKFLTGEYELLEGLHIQPMDQNKILISQQLAAENNLETGDKITLTHAELDQRDGIYMDSITEKRVFVDVEIAGIYTIEGGTDEPASPTAGKTVNHIISDSHLLTALQEQQQGIYEGEISFFIADPLHLDDMLQKVKIVSTIDWDNYILQENDFQYGKISGQLGSLQNLVFALITIVSILSITILMLILILQIRGRVQEAGILLAIGKTKAEIIGQFVLEAELLMLLGCLSALVFSRALTDMLNQILFVPLIGDSPTGIMQQNQEIRNYLQQNIFRTLILCAGELAVVMLVVLVSSGAVLSLKPKEILSKMC